MKKAYTMIALMVLVGSMAVAAQAQTASRTQLVASIQFRFYVGDQTMPAGEYTISQVNPSSDHAVLKLRAKDGSRAVMIQMDNVIGKAREGSQLVFNHLGSEYYFSQAWMSGDNTGWQASRSKAERTAKQELAGIKSSKETVALRLR
jgi:hypothetical protein